MSLCFLKMKLNWFSSTGIDVSLIPSNNSLIGTACKQKLTRLAKRLRCRTIAWRLLPSQHRPNKYNNAKLHRQIFSSKPRVTEFQVSCVRFTLSSITIPSRVYFLELDDCNKLEKKKFPPKYTTVWWVTLCTTPQAKCL